ncbi:MAG: hypothetical protein U0572_16480 [Phycisphaerales bacterium]
MTLLTAIDEAVTTHGFLDGQPHITTTGDFVLAHAINELVYLLHCQLKGDVDHDALVRGRAASAVVRKLLSLIDRIVQRESAEWHLGLDPVSVRIVAAWDMARRTAPEPRSMLLVRGPAEVMKLLDAKDDDARRELLRSLADLRSIVLGERPTAPRG